MYCKTSEQFFPICGHQYPELTEVDFKINYKVLQVAKYDAKIENETKAINKKKIIKKKTRT